MHKIFLGAVSIFISLGYSHGSVAAEDSLLQAIFTPFRQKEIVAVDHKPYQEECGACHFAYQPGLLPEKSWRKLLNPEALKNHFGANAELDQDTLSLILEYAVTHAADKSFHKRSRKIAQSTANGDAPIRITDVTYIRRKHHEIPEKMIKGNKDVKSLSYCDTCHTQALKGVFDSDTVNIPNYPDRDN
jgi:hypothetical protein